jgi:hypothetical protein
MKMAGGYLAVRQTGRARQREAAVCQPATGLQPGAHSWARLWSLIHPKVAGTFFGS